MVNPLYIKLARQALEKRALGSLIGGMAGGLAGKTLLKKAPKIGAIGGSVAGSLAGPSLLKSKAAPQPPAPPKPHVVGR
jgi:outer membrane lipoprotein SlyB